MHPDITYIAQIEKDQKSLAIDQLENFCVNTDDYTFNVDIIGEESTLWFSLPDEESTQWFKDQYEFSNAVPHKTLIGAIQLCIRDHESACDFEFWAVSSSVGKACLDSNELEGLLINFVKKLGGISLQLDYGNGNINSIYEHIARS